MKRKILFILIDGLIKVILLSCLGLLPLPLDMFELLILIFLILFSILSSIITQKILKHRNKTFNENFYLILSSNFITFIVFEVIREVYYKYIFEPTILKTNNTHVIQTFTKFTVSNVIYIQFIIFIVITNIIVSLISSGLLNLFYIKKLKA